MRQKTGFSILPKMLILLFGIIFLVFRGYEFSFLHKNLKWLVCYRQDITLEELQDADWAILDAAVDPKSFAGNSVKLIGYLSVGEAETYRPYWDKVGAAPYLIEKNPHWQNNFIVDVRHPDWIRILNAEADRMVQKGFNGIFLDTLDVAGHLERMDPQKYAGARRAVVNFVESLRQRHPEIIILPNNGLDLLEEIQEIVDGVVVEDLYTHHDFISGQVLRTDANVMAEKEKTLDAFRIKTDKPVLNILYQKSSRTKLSEFAISRSEAKKYLWYLTDIGLMHVGEMNP